MSARILLIEDDEKLAGVIQLWLEQTGYTCEWCRTGTLGLQQATSQPIDLVILDLALPGIDGWEICRRLRETSQLPIIMTTARGDEVARVRGLMLGADDYVVKPFSIPELVARVHTVLRRARGPDRAAHTKLRKGALEVDLDAHEVRIGATPVKLTPTEFRLLAYLLANQGRVATHRELLQAVWGPAYVNDVDSLRMCVRALRQKLEIPPEPGAERPRYIATEYGIGYRLL